MLDHLKIINIKKILRSAITMEKFLQIVTVLGVMLLVGYLGYEALQTKRSNSSSSNDIQTNVKRLSAISAH